MLPMYSWTGGLILDFLLNSGCLSGEREMLPDALMPSNP